MINGSRSRTRARIVIGHTVQLAYVDQSRDWLRGDKTVWEEISNGADILTVGKYETQSRAYIGASTSRARIQQKLVGTLSGGERGRCTWRRR
jgi:ATPase subunit of ABC transporter with duplicated ATPase domains